MKDSEGKNTFFPDVEEEIFVINANSKSILNYMTFITLPDIPLINMLAGPTATNFRPNEEDMDEEGYRSQEIYTQEKYFYLYYKGLILLETLYKHGIAHG